MAVMISSPVFQFPQYALAHIRLGNFERAQVLALEGESPLARYAAASQGYLSEFRALMEAVKSSLGGMPCPYQVEEVPQ